MNKFEEKAKDKYRLFGECGMCQEEKWLLARVIIEVAGAKIVSPKHYCKPCRKELHAKIK